LHGPAALGACAGRRIGEFLAKFELVIAILTLILINRHCYIPPFCAVLHYLFVSPFTIKIMLPICQYMSAAICKTDVVHLPPRMHSDPVVNRVDPTSASWIPPLFANIIKI
jgi:hypothetical protein